MQKIWQVALKMPYWVIWCINYLNCRNSQLPLQWAACCILEASLSLHTVWCACICLLQPPLYCVSLPASCLEMGQLDVAGVFLGLGKSTHCFAPQTYPTKIPEAVMLGSSMPRPRTRGAADNCSTWQSKRTRRTSTKRRWCLLNKLGKAWLYWRPGTMLCGVTAKAQDTTDCTS